MFSFLRDFAFTKTDSAGKPADGTDSSDSRKQQKSDNKTPKGFRIKRKNMAEELENLTTKYPYSRPPFLELKSTDELQVVLRHAERLITLPKRSNLPRNAGYAE